MATNTDTTVNTDFSSEIADGTYFDITERDGCVHIRPNDDITSAVSGRFRLILKNCLDKGALRYCFDFEKVTDIDTVALSSFIILHKHVEKNKTLTELSIINVNEEMMHLFKTIHIDQLFSVTEKQTAGI